MFHVILLTQKFDDRKNRVYYHINHQEPIFSKDLEMVVFFVIFNLTGVIDETNSR